MLFFIDLTLFALHICIIGFNLFGWIVPKWRKAHLWVVAVTLFSWIVLGFWFGYGYCILTDFEWEIKRQLGETNLPNSFVTYLANNVLGLEIRSKLIDIITISTFVPAIVASLYLNFRKKKS